MSVLFHALLLSVTFSGQTFGLPGLNLPWKERRLGADDLRILLAPALAPAPAPTPIPADISPTRMANAGPAAVDKPAVASNVPEMNLPPRSAARREAAAVITPLQAPAPAPAPLPVMPELKRPDVNLPIAPNAPKVRASAASETPAASTQASEVPARIIENYAEQKQLEQETQQRTIELARLEQEKQSAEKLRQAELTANAQREAARQEQLRQDAARAVDLLHGQFRTTLQSLAGRGIRAGKCGRQADLDRIGG